MPTDLQALLNRKEELDSQQQSGSFKFFSFVEGSNVLRLLPAIGNRTIPCIEVKKCFNVGPKKKVVIPRHQFGLPCPLQAELERLYKLGDEVSKKTADAMYPKNRVLFWVIDRADEGAGPQLLDINTNVYRDILAIMADPQYGDITDPQKGVDITIHFIPKTKTTNKFPEWNVVARRNSTPLGTDAQMAVWLAEDLFTKHNIGQPDTEEYIQKCLDGTVADKGESSPTYEAPAPAAPPLPSAPPVPASTPEPQVSMPGRADDKYWAVSPLTGQTAEVTAQVICEWIKAGKEGFMVMPYDQSKGWSTHVEAGFVKAAPRPAAPPPPAPAAPSPPPPPVASQQPSEAELRAKLEALRAQAGQSQVAQDLQNALKK